MQNASHDCFADCAENFVAYLFENAGFEVFSSSKWGADLAVHDRKDGSWWRIEIRSSSTGKKPRAKGSRRLKAIAEMLVEVRLKGRRKLDITFYHLVDGNKNARIRNPSLERLVEFMKREGE